MEPVKFEPPRDDFLHKVAALCKDRGVLLILDEMVSGFKWSLQGAHNYYGVKPDMATWGKGIANGFSACALTGRADIMELGGIRREGDDKLFLVSTTHGAETTGLAAMIATIREYQQHNMIESNWARGEWLKLRLEQVVRKHGLESALQLIGTANPGELGRDQPPLDAALGEFSTHPLPFAPIDARAVGMGVDEIGDLVELLVQDGEEFPALCPNQLIAGFLHERRKGLE